MDQEDNSTKLGSLIDIKASKAKNKTDSKDQPKPEKEKKAKIQIAEVYHDLSSVINRDKLFLELKLPAFPFKYYLVNRLKTCNEIIKVDENNIAKFASEKELASDILKFLKINLFDKKIYQLTAKQAKDCAEWWVMTAPIHEMPKMFLWANEPGETFNRLPWDYDPVASKECPTWDELLSRIKCNKEAYCHFIASIFFEDSYNQQYLWLNGQGNDGKGSLLEILSRIFGQFYTQQHPPNQKGDVDRYFWAIVGKRVITFDDVKGSNLKLPTHGWFMSLTGGSGQSMRANYEKPIDVKFNAKIIITANGIPQISSERSDVRRCIYVEFEDNPIDINSLNDNYKEKLWFETGNFLNRCIRDYLKAYPGRGFIKCEREALNQVLDQSEEVFESILNTHFRLDKDGFVPPGVMGGILKKETESFKAKFYMYLKNKHGVKYGGKKVSKEKLSKLYPDTFANINTIQACDVFVMKCYIGLSIRTDIGFFQVT
jgi:hypothetical protein